MKLSKINFVRLFLPFFLVSVILLSNQTFAQNDAEPRNKDILEYSDTELIERDQAEEDKKQSPRKKVRFGDNSGATFVRDFSMDIFIDNFFFSGLSFLLGADINGFITVGARIGFPVVSGYDAAKQIPGFTAIVGGSLQIEVALSLINSFLPDFTIVDVEFFLRGGSILGALLRLADLGQQIGNISLDDNVSGVPLDLNDRFSFYYKPTLTMGFNLLFINKFYIYAGIDFGDAIGSRPRLPMFVAPVAGIGFKIGT